MRDYHDLTRLVRGAGRSLAERHRALAEQNDRARFDARAEPEATDAARALLQRGAIRHERDVPRIVQEILRIADYEFEQVRRVFGQRQQVREDPRDAARKDRAEHREKHTSHATVARAQRSRRYHRSKKKCRIVLK